MQPQLAELPSHYMVLGPHPGGNTYSITRYFNFLREHLPPKLDWRLSAACPGNINQLSDRALPRCSRISAWYENFVRWPGTLSRTNAECFHIVDQGLMWYLRFLPKGKALGTVNDLIAYMRLKGSLSLPAPRRRQAMLVRENTHQLKYLNHIIAASRHTADCLMREVHIPSSRITVIHHHVDRAFQPLEPDERIRARARWFRDAEHVVLHVGNGSVYKNRLGVLKCFTLLHAKLPNARLFLVHGPPNSEEADFVTGVGARPAIEFVPPVSNHDLREIYCAADVLVFPSIYEGFGWPPLEAMACGCPVVSSKRASLAEVVGDGALTVEDPHDHKRLADIVYEVLTKDKLARELRARGVERATDFSEQKTSTLLADLYRSVA